MTGLGAERLQERSSSGLLGRCRSTGASTVSATAGMQYAAKVQVTSLANTGSLLTAYLDGMQQYVATPELLVSEVHLVSGTLLQISAMAAMLPSHAPTREKGKHWHLAVTTVSRKITISTAPRGDLRHRLKASMAANTQGRQQGWGNGGRGAPAHQRTGRQYQRSRLRQPLRQAPPHPQQPQQRP
ncbi:UNVERIFIED_CONTAM: hypothetical protein FKN15_061762 [Acipenser sinensis]